MRTTTNEKCKDCSRYKEGKDCHAESFDDKGKCFFFTLYDQKKQNDQYNALPPIFQKRIDRFRRNNSNFSRAFESYELCCCEEAVKIADFCKKNNRTVQEFHDNTVLQKGVIFDGHSGNSLGMACLLANYYLNQPDGVIIEHGSLAELTGCQEYGCEHPPSQRTIDDLSDEGKKKVIEAIKKHDQSHGK